MNLASIETGAAAEKSGRLTIESVLGEGPTVAIVLPLAQVGDDSFSTPP